ncbi:NADPH:quinone oxidoreductase family protein [Stutzerimonas stutzeri]|uniref:Zinc-binding dehydrogenase n=1 Tax=Stutzerimonas stutzeri TaxID=316 RepID=A0A6I6LPE4_STUST|nr:NADPH:quinone oxidoreductase family protein [Stutzerimonas stutzeri]QGZ31133.1 zinc-binding dehydrogenase [Stutzerimonas stutzeri]
MRAVICESFSGSQGLVFKDVETPGLGKGLVRIRVHYASVSYAITLMVAGQYQRKFALPFVPGTEVAGVVLECANDVGNVKPGDRVAAILDCGAFAEEAVADASNVYHIPHGFPLSKAVGIPLSFGTAATALTKARLGSGQTILVTGAGGALGSAAIRVAKTKGARVIAAASSADKLRAAIAAGADYGVNYLQEDLKAKVKAITEGRGVDIVFDPVGGELFETLIRSTAVDGVVLCLGFASGTIPKVPANLLLLKNLSLIGVNFSEYIGWGASDRRHEFAGQVQGLMSWLFTEASNGAIEVPEPQIYQFDEVISALGSIADRRAIGKIAIKIN